MKRILAPALLLAALAVAVGACVTESGQAQAQSSQGSRYYTAQQLAAIRALPEVGDDLRVETDDLGALLARGDVLFLDVREPKEIEENGTREGYVNIPLLELEERLDELPKDRAILAA